MTESTLNKMFIPNAIAIEISSNLPRIKPTDLNAEHPFHPPLIRIPDSRIKYGSATCAIFTWDYSGAKISSTVPKFYALVKEDSYRGNTVYYVSYCRYEKEEEERLYEPTTKNRLICMVELNSKGKLMKYTLPCYMY